MINGNAIELLRAMEADAKRLREFYAEYGLALHVSLHLHDHNQVPEDVPVLVAAAKALGWKRTATENSTWYDSPDYDADVTVWER